MSRSTVFLKHAIGLMRDGGGGAIVNMALIDGGRSAL